MSFYDFTVEQSLDTVYTVITDLTTNTSKISPVVYHNERILDVSSYSFGISKGFLVLKFNGIEPGEYTVFRNTLSDLSWTTHKSAFNQSLLHAKQFLEDTENFRSRFKGATLQEKLDELGAFVSRFSYVLDDHLKSFHNFDDEKPAANPSAGDIAERHSFLNTHMLLEYVFRYPFPGLQFSQDTGCSIITGTGFYTPILYFGTGEEGALKVSLAKNFFNPLNEDVSGLNLFSFAFQATSAILVLGKQVVPVTTIEEGLGQIHLYTRLNTLPDKFNLGISINDRFIPLKAHYTTIRQKAT